MKYALSLFVGIIQSSFLSTCSLIPRQPVLTVPIRFEEGFAFTRSFTVPASARYMLVLEFHKGTPGAVRLGTVPEDFAAKFNISSFETTATTGSSDSTPREGTFKPNYTARYLATFDAQGVTTYELSFRVIRADHSLLSTNPSVTIWPVPPGSL